VVVLTAASGFVRDPVDATRGELSFQIAEQEPLRFDSSPQYGIHVAERESTHKEVSFVP
jgi:hypothetical protein